MRISPLVDQLIEAFRCLPGVGPKSAQRMALYLLERNRPGAVQLSAALAAAAEQVGVCEQCRILTEGRLCAICADPRRDQALCCVVEAPADVLAIEQSAGFRGTYFVLGGHLSPIDGIGPEQLGIDRLLALVDARRAEELIIACNPTVEGDATAFYIAERLRGKPIAVTRIAHGVPVGGELEFVDAGTLSHALSGRKPLEGG